MQFETNNIDRNLTSYNIDTAFLKNGQKNYNGFIFLNVIQKTGFWNKKHYFSKMVGSKSYTLNCNSK